MADSSTSGFAALSEAELRRYTDAPAAEMRVVTLRHALGLLVAGKADVLARFEGRLFEADDEREEEMLGQPRLAFSHPRIEVFEAWLACAFLLSDERELRVESSLEYWPKLASHYGDIETQIEEALPRELMRRSFDRIGGLPEASERSFLIQKTREGDVQAAARLELLAFGLRELLLWRWARLVRDEKQDLAEMTLHELEREKLL